MSACSSINHCHWLCFADDMKLFLKVNSVTDCLYLQNGLNNFVACSESFGLTLNFNSWSMVYTSLRSPILHLSPFSYSINGANLLPIYMNICDLDFILTPFLCPRVHIDYIMYNAFKVIGVIKRLDVEFKFSNSLKVLFCSLVRPIVEYGSVFWDPQTADGFVILYCSTDYLSNDLTRMMRITNEDPSFLF